MLANRPMKPLRVVVLVVAVGFMLSGCNSSEPHKACSQHRGVVQFEVHDGVAYYVCADGSVGRA
jgi:hypothetical protein